MKKCLLIVLFLITTGCGEDAALTPLDSNATVLAFGDSLTAGYGASAGNSYPAQLSSLISRQVINAGISGEESNEGRQRLAGLLDRHNPELLILCHGGNDLLRKKPVTQLENNLVAMITMAKDRGIEVLMLGVPAPRIFLSSEAVYAEVAEANGVAFIPDLISDVLSSPSMKSDAVHPNATGYSEMARVIQQELQKLGAI